MMAILTNEQQLFLEQQHLSPSRVFNAHGMASAAYRKEMKELGMIVAYGVTPCREAGHTLRTSGGHCAQCKPGTLAFVMRWHDKAEVYVANSSQSPLIKVGVAQECKERLRTLNSHGYGGVNDWNIYFYYEVNNAGLVEFIAQQTLKQYRVARQYFRNDKIIDCHELFDCKVALAVEAVNTASVSCKRL